MSDWKARNEQALASVHPILAQRVRSLIDDLAAQNVPVLVVQAFRTYPEQAALYAKGRTAPGNPCSCNHKTNAIGACTKHPKGLTVTKAPPGYSSHNFGLAVDLCPDDLSQDGLQPDWNPNHDAWMKMLALGPQHKLAEGAQWRSFPDNPHFYMVELNDTPSEAVRAMLEKQGIQTVWDWASAVVTKPSAPPAASAS